MLTRFSLFPFFLALQAGAQPILPPLQSPDGRIELSVSLSDRIRYSVTLDGKPILAGEPAMSIDKQILGLQPVLQTAERRSCNRQLPAPVRQKSASVHEHYNELRLRLRDNYAITFRAYNEGIACRFETFFPENQVRVYKEEAELIFPENYNIYYPYEDTFFSHNERKYSLTSLNNIGSGGIATLPAVVDTGTVKVAIAESDVEDYPGLWLCGTGSSRLTAIFPPYPLKESLEWDRDLKITETADYLAITRGTRTYPWRLIGIARNDAELLLNQLVWLLAKPSQIADTSWIRPGKVAWDWWNTNDVYGVDFQAGINTATCKYFIDFAARSGLEYVILDEGWYKLGNVLQVNPEVDMEALVAYAREKNVGIILWVVWKTLHDQLEPAMAQFERWGIRGIKVDFLQRDDQPMVNFLHQICGEAARRKMLVDFHGLQRGAILTRTWPNLLTNEGVMGVECYKFGPAADPEHLLTLPFTRMFLGPMDTTPGALKNASKSAWSKSAEHPMSLGTRCQQLAMYVVYESPLQMLCDSPSSYLREPEMMEFLGPVPSVWDETKVLQARIGDYVAMARRNGQDWYIGAMTDWTAREVEMDFSFLGDGKYRLAGFQDGINADRHGSDYKAVRREIGKKDKLTVSLAPGGGWAAWITPVK